MLTHSLFPPGLLLLLAITSLLIVLRRRRRGPDPNPRKHGIADLFRGFVSRSTVGNRTSGRSSPETEEKRPLAPEPRRSPSTGNTAPFHLSPSPSSSSSSSSSASLSHSDVDADAFSVLSLPTTFAADRPTSTRFSAGTYTGTFLSPTPLRQPTYPAPAVTRPDPNGKNPSPGHGPPQLGAPPIPLTARLSSVGVG
ncbi:uncharacterized protein P884DRAFT_299991 [Thermothelomyces heterothallicus CBS 202.75]|uniref:uncharacterized protein n=1 Tax=Thermothelomyces heterothallicus CBS 202.75 TaxID=1149848 RepID=UPI0037425B3F